MLDGCGSESTIQFFGTSCRTMNTVGFVGRILDDVFLFGDPDSEVRALAVRDLLFNMLGR